MTEPQLPETDSARNQPLEPPRLLESSSEGFERGLVAAAAAESVPATARERMARALGVPNRPLVPARTPAHATRIGSGGSLLGWGAAGALSLALAAHALHARRGNAPHQAEPEEARRESGQSLESVQSPAPKAELLPTEAVRVVTEPSTESAKAKVGARPRSGTSSTRPGMSSMSPALHSLRPELAALAQIQGPLRAGQAATAADALKAYRRQFPHGELAIEAELLGVDIALARGQEADAQALARGILARPEGDHYRQRLEALLARSHRESAHSSAAKRGGPHIEERR